jgi:hypothetical protein
MIMSIYNEAVHINLLNCFIALSQKREKNNLILIFH